MNQILVAAILLAYLTVVPFVHSSSSFDALISSQCKAKCLSLYPWKLHASNITGLLLFKRNERSDIKINSNKLSNRHSSHVRIGNKRFINQTESNTNHHSHNLKWNKVMELCSKNQNCLQCSLPCEIPTNLLPNCKYLCKNQHPYCIESCNLLMKLNQDRYGTCPTRTRITREKVLSNQNDKFLSSFSRQIRRSSSALSSQPLSDELQCTNETKSIALANLIRHEHLDDTINLALIRQNRINSLVECKQNSDCGEWNKCCPIDEQCPLHGQICLRPLVDNDETHWPSVPSNLTITERKKGKTVILSWSCSYLRTMPTIFVIEGQWSLRPPYSTHPHHPETHIDPTGNNYMNEPDNAMTEWGYLASTVNANSVILRNINRGRWYKFRVSSISSSGTKGFSKPTELFILSSPPKPPTQPQNLSVTRVYSSLPLPNSKMLNDSNLDELVDLDLAWLPPKRSDLPISQYKISWKLIRQNLTQKNLIHHNKNDNDDDDDYSQYDNNNNELVANNQEEDVVNEVAESPAHEEILFNQNPIGGLNHLLILDNRDDLDLYHRNSASNGHDLLDANKLENFKHRLRGLYKNALYSISIVAIANYENKRLISSSKSTRVHTSRFSRNFSKNAASQLKNLGYEDIDDLNEASSILSTQSDSDADRPKSKSDYEDEEENAFGENDEDYDLKVNDENPIIANSNQNHNLDKQNANNLVKSTQAKSNHEQHHETKRQSLLKNLTVQMPYFQNGLVKAKISWQLATDQIDFKQPITYRLTWFPVKCFPTSQMDDINQINNQNSQQFIEQRRQISILPAPITASTQNKNYEIYELKYNCDYSINVRLQNPKQQQEELKNTFQINTATTSRSSSNNQAIYMLSAQFRVPKCSSINVIGNRRPFCYDEQQKQESNQISDNQQQTSQNRNKYQKSFLNLLYSTSSETIIKPTTSIIIISSSSSSSSTGDMSDTTIDNKILTTTTLETTLPNLNLPRIVNIRYKIVDKIENLYSIEFSWSLASNFDRNLFSGYQISVIPKEEEKEEQQQQHSLSSNNNQQELLKSSHLAGAYFGSVGAIVSKDQHKFIVRQLTSSIRYIFQIQSIGLDGQTYGPASYLEFKIQQERTLHTNKKSSNNASRNRPLNDFNYRNNEYAVLNINNNENSLKSSSNSNNNNNNHRLVNDYSLLFQSPTSTTPLSLTKSSSLLLNDYSDIEFSNNASSIKSSSCLFLALVLTSLIIQIINKL